MGNVRRLSKTWRLALGAETTWNLSPGMVALLYGEPLGSIRNGNCAIRLLKIVGTMKIGINRNLSHYEELMFVDSISAVRLPLSGPPETSTVPALPVPGSPT